MYTMYIKLINEKYLRGEMEQRKLIQHGKSSLTMALPMSWLKQRGLGKGDSINVDAQGNQLIISTDAAKQIGRWARQS